MNVSQKQIEDFLISLKRKRSFFQVDILGVCENTLNKTINQANEVNAFGLKSLSFYSKEPKLIFSTPSPLEQSSPSISRSILSLLKTFLSNTLKSSPYSLSSNEISYTKFMVNSSKYYLLNIKKNDIVVLGQFTQETKSAIIKLYLVHITNAFLNYINSKANMLNNSNNLPIVDQLFSIKIFDVFLINSLTQHFNSIIQNLFKKRDLHLHDVKYKTFYLVDLSSNEIIINLATLKKKNKPKKRKDTNNKMLWNELMYHSHNLKDQYMQKHNNRFDIVDYQDYFVKVEYSVSYPRLTFIIKFLPLLKGMTLIHVFTQNRLSRNEDMTKQYKEFDIVYGNEMNKECDYIEYRYKEPKKLKEIEWFFVEFLLSTSSTFGAFFYPKTNLKYFDSTVFKIIEQGLVKDNEIIKYDESISKMTKLLYEEYLQLKEKEMHNRRGYNGNNNQRVTDENNIDENESSIQKNDIMATINLNLLTKNNEIFTLHQISTYFVLKEIFTLTTSSSLKAEDMTIVLSRKGDYDEDNNNTMNEIHNSNNISKLLNHDMTILSKLYTANNYNKTKDIHQNEHQGQGIIEKSLFDINLTAIETKSKNDIENHRKPLDCKSEAYLSKRKNYVKKNKTTILEQEGQYDSSEQSQLSNEYYFNNSYSNDNDNPNRNDFSDSGRLHLMKETQTIPTNRPMLSTTGNKL